MNRSRHMVTIVALSCAALVAGCGSSSSSTTTKTTPAPSSTASLPTPGSVGAGAVEAAVGKCRQVIQSQTKLPASAKTKLEGACTQAAKGNTEAVKVAAREVCEEVIARANLPGGAAKEAAQKACKR